MKRGVSKTVITWDESTCNQCNKCALVCPHAAVRPIVCAADADVPDTFKTAPLKGYKKALVPGDAPRYRMQISPLDCLDCGECILECPKSALSKTDIDSEVAQADIANFEWAYKQPYDMARKLFPEPSKTLKASQFQQPLFEFSGACAGCQQTPYLKLLTQLFGDQMSIGIAVGCVLVYSHLIPLLAYSKHKDGSGIPTATSLFEDLGEFGLGITIGARVRRAQLKASAEAVVAAGCDAPLKTALEGWLAVYDDRVKSFDASKLVKGALPASDEGNTDIGQLISSQDLFAKRSSWIVGGDGWAYDIGFGGLMHILASGDDINVMIFDNEMYANTGGQLSKASVRGTVQKCAWAGVPGGKRDLAGMIISGHLGGVYVANVAMGANQMQTLKAMREAEAFPGPAVVIGFSPCVLQGIAKHLSMKDAHCLAVESGMWPLFRYNPLLRAQGKNPLSIDSKIKRPISDYVSTQVRFNALKVTNPERAAANEALLEADVKARWATLRGVDSQFVKDEAEQ